MSEQSSHKDKVDWREVLRQLDDLPDQAPKTQPAPTSRQIDPSGSDTDAGILGDDAFELEREQKAMEGSNK